MQVTCSSVVSDMSRTYTNVNSFRDTAEFYNIMNSPMLASSVEVPRSVVENIQVFRIHNEFAAFSEGEEIFRIKARKENIRYSNDSQMIVFKTPTHKYYLKSQSKTEFEQMKNELRRLFQATDENIHQKTLLRIDHENKKIHYFESGELLKFDFRDIKYKAYFARDFSFLKMSCCGWEDMCYRGRREQVELLREMIRNEGGIEM